jgi:hypothetical protein
MLYNIVDDPRAFSCLLTILGATIGMLGTTIGIARGLFSTNRWSPSVIFGAVFLIIMQALLMLLLGLYGLYVGKGEGIWLPPIFIGTSILAATALATASFYRKSVC